MADSIAKFLGGTVEEAAGFGAGSALKEPLQPILQALTNETWSKLPNVPLDAQVVAQAVAEGKITKAAGAAEAALTGISAARFGELVVFMQEAPGVAEALTLARRGLISPDALVTALQRAGLEPEWIQPIIGTLVKPLDPAEIALAIVRGNMSNAEQNGEAILPVGPPTDVGLVPADPVSPIDPVQEASWTGVDFDRLAVMARNLGLPAAVGEMLQMLNRGIIEDPDFYRGVAEGDTRNQGGDKLYQLRYAILSANDYVSLRVRGWIDDQAMYTGGALSGYSTGQMDQLFQAHGRPLSWHQIWIGLQRGGVYGGPTDELDPAFLKGLEESDIRPEWYNLAWAQRYTIPSYFVLKPLVAGGTVTVDECTELFVESGWPPDLAAKAAASFAPSTPTAAATPTKAYTTSAVKTVGKAYIDSQITEDETREDLTTLGIPDSEQDSLIAIWDVQRKATVRTLTQAELRYAYRKGALTEDVALERLEALGLSDADAATYLAS